MPHPLVAAVFAALAAALAAPAVARAETPGALDLDPAVRASTHALFAISSVGRLSGTGGGVGVGASLRLGPIALTGELESAWVELDDDASGFSTGARLTRARLLATLALLEYQTDRFRGGMHMSGGVGGEWIDLAGGERLWRDVVSWGLDTAHGFAVTDRSIVNADLGWRIDLARAPGAGKVIPGCTGPCTSLTQTAPIDMSLSLVIALRWGPIGPEGRR